MKPAYNVGAGTAVFVCRDGKVLMQQRTGAHGDGSWAPPGGKIDHGEDPALSAAREVKEESNLEVSNLHYIGFTNDVFEEGLHYITLWYVTNEVEGKEKITEPHKCIGQEWRDLDDLPKPLFLTTAHILEDEKAMANVKNFLETTK